MRIEGELFFNPTFKWSQINTEEVDVLIDEYEKRLKGYYLQPVYQLFSDPDSNRYNGFAAGVLLLCAIDAVGTFQAKKTKKKDFENKFIDFIKSDQEFIDLEQKEQRKISKMISNAFRNGLVHNGMIKNTCEFSFESPGLFYFSQDSLVINPYDLLACVQRNLERFFEHVRSSSQSKLCFKDRFERFYQEELKKFR